VKKGLVKNGMPSSLISCGYALIRNSILPRAAALRTIHAQSAIQAMGENYA
jgi:hypothetical protein